MIILDFSTNHFEALDPTIHWQKNILDFWQEWTQEKDHIVAQTSGSTGSPKEIKLPKSAMKMSARLTGKFFDLTPGKTALLCLPIEFIAGKMMLVRAIELRLKLICIEPKSHINADEIPSIDFAPMTPMQVEKSITALNKIQTLLIGGAPLSDPLRKVLLQKNTHCFESYGMTETITHIALKEISQTYFQTLDKIQIRKNDSGCLVIKTPYFEEEIITNDLVDIPWDNQFKWLGRFDSVINSGGIKLIPEQIEQKLKPFIAQNFIISALTDATLGEKLILIIEGKEQNIDIPENILSKFEVPKKIYFVDQFPTTVSGKLQRKEILKLL